MSAILGTAVTGSAGAYTIDNSLRIRSSASAYLSRSIGSTTNNTKWTWSAWIKLGTIPTGEQGLFGAGGGAFFNVQFWASTPGALAIRQYNGSADVFQLITTQLFRDPSSWYHLVVAYDSTQATASNRIKLYVNGSQVTAFSTASYPGLNQTTYVNTSGNPMQFGRRAIGDNYWDGYVAEQILVDGQQLDASSFGATNASTGVWQPKAYTGTYGTNGFYQKYSDVATTSASNAGLGKDFSGNGNYFVTNNISVTAGSTYDAMTDSPTPKSATVGNFATLNPILQNGWWAAPSRGSISYGNLRLSQNNGTAFSTFDVNTNGKWYCELTITSYGQASASSEIIVSAYSRNTFEVAYYRNGNKSVNNTVTAYGATWTTGDVIGIAIDKTNNQVTFYKNNVSQGTITNTFPNETVLVGYYAEATGTDTVDFNFGQRPFTYTPPSGYVRLQSYNLPTPTIGASSTKLANKYFDILLYTGDGSSNRALTGLNFQPDFVWNKARSNAYSHKLYDAVRGVTKQISSDLTTAEVTTGSSFLVSFDSGGITIGNDTGFNGSGATFVDWFWKANGAGSTNTSGSITSTVSANTTSGFSIVTWTYNSSGGTIGHGLGAAPKMILQKDRSSGAGYNWDVYTSTTGPTQRLILNSTVAAQTYSGPWNNTAPTSTVFSSGSAWYTNGDTMVSYCFAEVAGFSKFGSYTGNGSADGPFINLGFRPKYVMFKRTDSAGHWIVFDTSRDPYNVTQNSLQPDSSVAENQSYGQFDLVSNGIKIRTTDIGTNASGGSYIYMAFAESPFNYSLAR